jgi:hypothetical protein
LVTGLPEAHARDSSFHPPGQPDTLREGPYTAEGKRKERPESRREVPGFFGALPSVRPAGRPSSACSLVCRVRCPLPLCVRCHKGAAAPSAGCAGTVSRLRRALERPAISAGPRDDSRHSVLASPIDPSLNVRQCPILRIASSAKRPGPLSAPVTVRRTSRHRPSPGYPPRDRRHASGDGAPCGIGKACVR